MRRISSIVAASAAVVSCVFMTRPAEAVVTPKNSADFGKVYDMDSSDTRLTATGGDDWTKGGIAALLSGGFLSYNSTAGQEAYWQAKTAIWDGVASKHANGWTIEFRLKVNSAVDNGLAPQNPPTAPARDRAFSVFASDSAVGPGTTAILEVGTGNTWTPSHNGSHLDNNSNSDDYHTFRIAFDPNALATNTQFLVWRDGVSLLEPGAPPSLTHTSGGFLNNNFYFGDGTSGYGGNVSIDYMRFDLGGAYSPLVAAIPEPASLGTLALVGLVARRRRR